MPDQAQTTERRGGASVRRRVGVRQTHRERRAATREALLAAAVDVINDRGYASTTTTEIAGRAKVTRGALQYHFTSRDDLVLAVVDHVMTELNFRLDTTGLSGQPLEVRVEALISQYRKVFGGPLFRAAIQILLGAVNDPTMSGRIRNHVLDKQAAMDETWKEIFRGLDLRPRALASLRRVTMAAIRGYVLLEAFGINSFWTDDTGILRDLLITRLRAE